MLEHEGNSTAKVSCEICGRILSDIPCLKRHMRSTHPTNGLKREFKCTVCSKMFTCISKLEMHERRVHKSKYARKCTLCEKTFKGPSALKENFKNHSYICGACWQELVNFHDFYLKVEIAHANLSIIINSEIVADDVSSDKEDLPEQSLIEIKEVTLLEPENLFVKDENPLEICEKADIEKVSCFEKSTKRKRSLKKSSNDKKNISKNISKRRFEKEKDANEVKKADEIDISMKEVENEDVKKVNCFKKRTVRERCAQKRTNDKKTISRNNSNKTFKKEKVTTDVIKSEINENEIEDEIDIKLKQVESDNFSDQNDSFESDDDDRSSSSMDSSKLEQLHQEQDKFIAENFQMNCSLCDIPLASFDMMVTHYKEEHNQRGYINCCDQKLYSRLDIVDHIKLHKNPEYFKCKYCGKTTNSRLCLKLHCKNVHEEKNIKCDICGKSLASKSSLKTHKLLHDANNIEKIPCEQCDKSYISKRSLANHMRICHIKKHIICDLCGKSLRDGYRFKIHMLEHEGKTKPGFSCKVCGRVLSDKGCLTRHMRSCHPPNGIKSEFNCTLCTKVFKSNANLKEHVWVVHENKYARKCTVCGKTFKRSAPLKDHMSLHIGKPLHACGFCPKIFFSSGNMHTHRKTLHPVEWQKSVGQKKSRYLPQNVVSADCANPIK